MREDNILIRQIAQRAEYMLAHYGVNVQWEFIASELRIVHFELCELRLKELLDADDGNFAHDVMGIHDHLDRLNGSFRDGFSPRFAKE